MQIREMLEEVALEFERDDQTVPEVLEEPGRRGIRDEGGDDDVDDVVEIIEIGGSASGDGDQRSVESDSAHSEMGYDGEY